MIIRRVNRRSLHTLWPTHSTLSSVLLQEDVPFLWPSYDPLSRWEHNPSFVCRSHGTHSSVTFQTYIYIYIYNPDDYCNKTAWNQRSQVNIHAIKYIYKLIHIYLLLALSQILSTLQIIPHLVCHKPTKWDNDNHILLYIYIYIYI